MNINLRENTVTERRDGPAKRPGGSQIVGWVAMVFCGLLAFNAATIASSDGMRAFLIVDGVVLIGIFVILLGRWFFKRENPVGPRGR
jgi:drug/metabolite transporter (DMT)-like permease